MQTLVDFFGSKQLSKVYDINGLKVGLRTIDSAEHDLAVGRFNLNPEGLITSYIVLRRPVLGFALESINGVQIKDIPEIKEALAKPNPPALNLIVETALGKLPVEVIDAIYSKYEELVDERDKKDEEVKKS